MAQKYKWYVGIAILFFAIGKFSNPAKIETKIVEIEKIVYVEVASKEVASKKTTSTKTKADGTKIEKVVEEFASSENSSKMLDSDKSKESTQVVTNALFGIYGGAGIDLSNPLKKPFISGIITYKMVALSCQTDLQSDHRVAAHIGLQF